MEIVEVRRNGYSIAVEMNQMRDWLDTQRIEPLLFQFKGVVLSLGSRTKVRRRPSRMPLMAEC